MRSTRALAPVVSRSTKARRGGDVKIVPPLEESARPSNNGGVLDKVLDKVQQLFYRRSFVMLHYVVNFVEYLIVHVNFRVHGSSPRDKNRLNVCT